MYLMLYNAMYDELGCYEMHIFFILFNICIYVYMYFDIFHIIHILLSTWNSGVMKCIFFMFVCVNKSEKLRLNLSGS